jgi:ASC-1-like (ASCH) protein
MEERDLIDEIVFELLCTQDLANEIVELVEEVRKRYDAGEEPILDEELFSNILDNINAMKNCVIRARELFEELQKQRAKELFERLK